MAGSLEQHSIIAAQFILKCLVRADYWKHTKCKPIQIQSTIAD